MSTSTPESGKAYDKGIERGEDRRQEHRDVEHDRRVAQDRRNIHFGVKFATTGSLITLEDWLDVHCSEAWRLVLLGMDDDLDRKEIQIMFASKADKDRFVANFMKRS